MSEPSDVGELIDAAGVAEILGLSHPNSVSTYRRRYPGFPEPVVSPRGRRRLLWQRGEVLAWRQTWTERTKSRRGPLPVSRLNDLIAATKRLMLANPAERPGIRQIAAEAGIAHSDVYRYARSKDHLLALAAEEIVADFSLDLPDSLDEIVDNVDTIVATIFQRSDALRVLASGLDLDSATPTERTMPVSKLARLIAEDRAGGGDHPIRPEVNAGCVAAMLWGWAILGGRYREHLGLAGLPEQEIARMAAAMMRV